MAQIVEAKLGALRERYLVLTKEQLPTKAAAERWSLRFDHCFMRVILDHLFEDSWYAHLDRKQPAYKQLSEGQLEKAIRLGEMILAEGEAALKPMNAQSLRWRGKA